MTLYAPVGLDGADPGIITGKAISIISGGQAVGVSGAVDVVTSSGRSSFDPETDLHFGTGATYASGLNFIGIATQTVASGDALGVATRGCFVVRAANTVTVNRNIAATADGDGFVTTATAGQSIGRALTGATSGAYFVLQLK